MDNLTDMVAWEEGTLSEEGEVNLFQRLVDSGLAWQLQGMYGRQAQLMLQAGVIHLPGQEAKHAE